MRRPMLQNTVLSLSWVRYVAFVLSFGSIVCPVVLHAADQQITDELKKGIRKSVVFSIVPDKQGHLAQCAYSKASDLATRAVDASFQPSAAYVAEACDTLKRGTWRVDSDGAGTINPVYDFCFWSEAAPDKPICRVQLSK
jgi:hypothetical protein